LCAGKKLGQQELEMETFFPGWMGASEGNSRLDA
jgi:hypothetical protein